MAQAAKLALSFNVPVLSERFDYQLAQQSTIEQLRIIENYDTYDAQDIVCGIIDRSPRVLLSIHREASKSTIAESFCFRKLNEKRPHLIVYFSINEDAAKAHLKAIKMKYEKPLLKNGKINRYAQLKPKRTKENYEWGSLAFTLKNGNRIIGGGIGKGILGLKEGDLRPTIIIIDDPVPLKSGEDVGTLDWLRKTVMPLGSPKTQIIIVGTPRRYLDLIMSIVNDPDSPFEVYNFPAILDQGTPQERVLIPEFWKRRGICCEQRNYFCYGLSDHQRENAHKQAFNAGLYRGTHLDYDYRELDTSGVEWSEKQQICCDMPPKYRCWWMEDDSDLLMWQHIKQKKLEVKSIAWATEYMCVPQDDGSTLFPRDILDLNVDTNWSFMASRKWANSINKAYEIGGEVPDRIQCVIGADLSIGTSPDSDFTVFSVVQVKPQIRLLDVFRGRGIPYQQQKREMLKLYQLYRPAMIYVESNQYQAVFPQDLKDEFGMLPIYKYNTHGEKHTYQVGVPSMKDYFEQGQFSIPSGDIESNRYMETMFEEFSGIVFDEGKVVSTRPHDDTVMSTWIAIQAGREYYGSILQAY